MANVNKNKLKKNDVSIGDGQNTDKKLSFNIGSGDNPYIEYESDSSDLKYSPTGLPGDEVKLTGQTTYTHIQGVPSADWTINHNLSRYPSVSCVDSAGSEVHGEVKYLDGNSLTVSFAGAFSGRAYLN